MPHSAHAPMVGDCVHFYEMRGRRVIGPLAAIVTWTGPDDVTLAVVGEAAMRFVPLVPYDDGGSEAGQWWTWRRPVRAVRQNGL